ncbi:MIP-related peptides precursor [Elysia marginata]|uniref:MIP-related peptides n=1 Tax=Elysia marginata TaxID=1093978 RepID=A0AAV4E9J4_9GAST|nr:MIP-related peptides precursor [Elysia marginata]
MKCGRSPATFLLVTWLSLALTQAGMQSAATAAKLESPAPTPPCQQKSLSKSDSNHAVSEAQSASDISNCHSSSSSGSDSSSVSNSNSQSQSASAHAMFKRGAPRFLGKRQKAPKYLGKRQKAPRFPGKRQTAPRFLGKRQMAPRFLGKRQQAPRFLGKRPYAPRFLGKRQSAPRFLGKRQYAPRFLGKRRQLVSGLLDTTGDGQGLLELSAPSFSFADVDDGSYLEDKRLAAPKFLGKRLLFADDTLRKREGDTPFVNAAEFIKTYRKSDPYFMGKRDIGLFNIDEDDGENVYGDSLLDEDMEDGKRGAPRFLGKRGAPRFLGKRGAPRFLGKRGAPRFLGKRGAPRFLGKRGAPRFLGKRGAPRFLGKRGAPRFLGKRGAPRFLGKRGAPRFLGKRGAPRFLGKRGAPRFLGKRDFDGLTTVFHDDPVDATIDDFSGLTRARSTFFDDAGDFEPEVSLTQSTWSDLDPLPSDESIANIMKLLENKGGYSGQLLDSPSPGEADAEAGRENFNSAEGQAQR